MKAKIDLHIHSDFSDGTDSPEELIRKVKEKELEYFSLTDHDTNDGVREILKMEDLPCTFIRGIEFSCLDERGECHILGYDYDIEAPAMQNLVEKARKNRLEKTEVRISQLKEQFGIELTEEEKNFIWAKHSPGKPHFAEILINRGLALDKNDAITQYLDKIQTDKFKIPAEEAVKAILDAGGIPVWAHPLSGAGKEHLTEEQFECELRLLREFGIRGLECFYSQYDDVRQRYLERQAEKAGLYISAGSDYHGNGKKDIEPGLTGKSGGELDSGRVTILEAFRK